MRLRRPNRIEWCQGLLVLALATIWWPALTTHYGLSDDYSYLAYWGHPDLEVIGSDVVRLGRPFTAVLMRIAFLAYQTVEGLLWLRVLGAAFMAWFGVLLFRSLKDAGWPDLRAWMTSLLLLATPPFTVYAGWAITCVGPISAVAALWGSRVYLNAFSWSPVASTRRKAVALGLAVAMIVIAACFYQPTSCLFLLLPLASALTRPTEDRTARQWLGLGATVVVFVGALALYFVLFKFTMSSLASADWASQRGTLVTDFAGKLRFLWARPITDMLALWTPLRPEGPSKLVWSLSLGATVLAIIGLFARPRFRWDALAMLAFALVAFALAYLPVAAVAENTATYRTQVAPHAVWLLFVVAGLAGFAPLLGKARMVGPALFGVSVFVFAFQARHALKAGIVEPQHREWSVITGLLDDQVNADTKALCFRMPHGWIPSATVRGHEEFGRPTTRTTWGANCLPLVHLRERFSRPFAEALPILPFAPWRTVDPCGAVLIDAYGALSGDPGAPEPERTYWGHFISELQLPPLGTVELYDGRWVYSRRFGYAMVKNLPAFDRSTKPPTARVPAEEGLYFFLLCEGHWFWTSEATFPVVHDLDRGKQTFIFEERDTGQPVLIPYPVEATP